MQRTAVINVVGLTESLLGPDMPRVTAFARAGALSTVTPAFPAVTCTAQANYLTGRRPVEHGIVANGWYDRTLAEVQFWKQSNHLVRSPKIWEDLRQADPNFTCAQLFWWYNMYSSVDYAITPRPIYRADGRKIFDIYSWPSTIRPDIKADLGEFPFPGFWGPAAGSAAGPIAPDAASRWIAESAKWIERKHQPTLSLVYLPHLDYNLQRLGLQDPNVRRDLHRIDGIVGDLLEFFQGRSVQALLMSEYGITPVNRPIHLNRVFREQGWIAIREELGLELLDCGASQAFAVADHQVAHVYVNDRRLWPEVEKVLSQIPGVEEVLGRKEQSALGIDHERAGDFVVTSSRDAWFTYYYWEDDSRAPDFARTVDIHRKPGYDPVELFLDPAQRRVKLKIGWRLLQKKLGFRMLMDVIPLDAALVRGSHGRRSNDPKDQPVVISSDSSRLPERTLDSTEVYRVIRDTVLKPSCE